MSARASELLLEQDRGDDDDALGDRLGRVLKVVLDEDVGAACEDQDAEHGADDGAAAAAEQRAADDDRGDGVELVEAAVRGGAGVVRARSITAAMPQARPTRT